MISRRKVQYKVGSSLRQYLYHFGRQSDIPLVYNDLVNFTEAMPYEDPSGEETLWLTVLYPPEVMRDLREKLIHIYAELKIGGAAVLHDHLIVDRIDFGEFGNSRPFRIKITNQYNDNSDYYYVKIADASRIYGLELEHILSPKRLNYLVNGNTLIEDHIAGVPGDVFMKDYMNSPEVDPVRISKEFVKFNERCFIRLLGDMRSVNYVVDITPDFEEVQYRVRPIDFDQQSYEKNGRVYTAFQFRSNRNIVRVSVNNLNKHTIDQYVEEERSQMARRVSTELRRLTALLRIMRKDEIAPDHHIIQLREDLNKMHKTKIFSKCQTMGELTASHIQNRLEITGVKW